MAEEIKDNTLLADKRLVKNIVAETVQQIVNKEVQAIARANLDIFVEPSIKEETTIMITNVQKNVLYKQNTDYAVAHNGKSITILPYSAIQPVYDDAGQEINNILITYTTA